MLRDTLREDGLDVKKTAYASSWTSLPLSR
jgi:hypothetical protein